MLIESTFSTPMGWLKVQHDEHYIHQSEFTDIEGHIAGHSLSKQIHEELSCYFNNRHHRFQLLLKPQGSHYQQKVWAALLVIPAGRTVTYGELAASLQTSPRAVGQACKKNPITLFIPCHRVVGKDNYGGYMGRPEALSYKLDLLKHESIETS